MPPFPGIDLHELNRRFVHHVPGPRRTPMHTAARRLYREFAGELAELLPESREKSLAFTALEESSFWAHACIAPQFFEDDEEEIHGDKGGHPGPDYRLGETRIVPLANADAADPHPPDIGGPDD